MDRIDSRDNHLIKEIKKLKDRKYREEKKLFIIEGFRFLDEAIKSSFNIRYIFIDEDVVSKFSNNNYYLDSKIKICVLNKKVYKDIALTKTPQGVSAVLEMKQVVKEETNGFYVLLDKLQDPGNVGTIIRTAHAFNALGVIVTKGSVDIYNEKTLRSTMGSIFKVPIIYDKDLSFIKSLKTNGFKLIATSLNDSKSIMDENISGNVILTLGNEGNGVSEEIFDLCDIKIRIPMPGGAESLNVSTAGSIMMYEYFKNNR
ncbi:MAG: TrmH family RNA methyltransferase [Clostridiaceae bacterium]